MAKPTRNPRQKRYPPDFKVKVVKTSLKKHLSVEEACRLFHVGPSTWWTWKRVFRTKGEDALCQHGNGLPGRRKQLPPKAKEKIRGHVLEIKRKFPFYGVLRVWQWMLRVLFLPVSYRQVRTILAEENLLFRRRRRRHQLPEPRRFERSRPNELWQSDITPVELPGGLKLHLIGFLDDHSRYIVSWGFYAGYTAELVLEVLRRAFATYGRPTELLTDQGPPYKTWRGKTQFQNVLAKEKINHILSRPKHPETLGKIESFWAQVKKEFFEELKHRYSLEEVRERLTHWVNAYNFQRYHTEIKCAPAERFFQYQEAMKAEIQKRLKANEEALALLDTAPSTVIGETPMGEQKVEVKKDGNEFVVTLGDQVMNRMEFSKKEESHETQEGTAGGNGSAESGREGQGVDGAVRVVGGEDDRGGVPGDGSQAPVLLQTGGTDGAGDGGDGTGAAGAGKEEGSVDGGNESGGGNGSAAPGAPEAAKPDENLQETRALRDAETEEIPPGKGENGSCDGGAGGGAGSAAPTGSASPTDRAAGIEIGKKEG